MLELIDDDPEEDLSCADQTVIKQVEVDFTFRNVDPTTLPYDI